MTDEQKAVACWRFMLDHYYHWYPPKEECVPEFVRDFANAINSYGFGPCFVNAPVLTDLWEAAGLETRSWTITGHSIDIRSEVELSKPLGIATWMTGAAFRDLKLRRLQ